MTNFYFNKIKKKLFYDDKLLKFKFYLLLMLFVLLSSYINAHNSTVFIKFPDLLI